MEKPKILIELYKGLLNRVVTTVDAEIHVIADGENLGKWEPVILVNTQEEFRHLADKIIIKEI